MLFSSQFGEVSAEQNLEPTAKHLSWNRIMQALLSRFGILVSLSCIHGAMSSARIADNAAVSWVCLQPCIEYLQLPRWTAHSRKDTASSKRVTPLPWTPPTCQGGLS